MHAPSQVWATHYPGPPTTQGHPLPRATHYPGPPYTTQLKKYAIMQQVYIDEVLPSFMYGKNQCLVTKYRYSNHQGFVAQSLERWTRLVIQRSRVWIPPRSEWWFFALPVWQNSEELHLRIICPPKDARSSPTQVNFYSWLLPCAKPSNNCMNLATLYTLPNPPLPNLSCSWNSSLYLDVL